MGEIPPQPTGLEPLEEVFDKRLGITVWRQAQPTHCHLGHRYRETGVSISWVGCQCKTARGGGHDVYFCWAPVDGGRCMDQRWQAACADPSRQNEQKGRG